MHHIADVVSVALGLEELRDIRWQRVLLMNLLKISLVEPLERKEGRGHVGCTQIKVKIKKKILQKMIQ